MKLNPNSKKATTHIIYDNNLTMPSVSIFSESEIENDIDPYGIGFKFYKEDDDNEIQF